MSDEDEEFDEYDMEYDHEPFEEHDYDDEGHFYDHYTGSDNDEDDDEEADSEQDWNDRSQLCYEWDNMRMPMWLFTPRYLNKDHPRLCLLDKAFRRWPPQPRPPPAIHCRRRHSTKKAKHSSEKNIPAEAKEVATEASFRHDQCALCVQRRILTSRSDQQKFYQAVKKRPYIQRLAIPLNLQEEEANSEHVLLAKDIVASDPSRRWRLVCFYGGISPVDSTRCRNEILDSLHP
jgi:hypothetical protein